MEKKRFWRDEVIGGILARDVDEAVREERTLIEAYPEEARPYCRLGVLLHFQGRKDEAIGCFQKSVELDAAAAEPHIHLGRIHAMEENYESAWNHARQAEKLGDPSLREQLERYPKLT